MKNEDTNANGATDETTESSSKESTPPALPITRYENKHFVNCLDEYKKFYVSFIKSKVLPHTDIPAFFKTLVYDKQQRTKELMSLLDRRLSSETNEFTPVDCRTRRLTTQCLTTMHEALAKVSSAYENAMGVASNILLEFCAFPNLLTSSGEKKVPFWLEALIASACCREVSRETQLTAMTTLLEIFSLSKNQNYLSNTEKNVVINGILEHRHVYYIEGNTLVIEVTFVVLMCPRF